jgi:hypothetical protein
VGDSDVDLLRLVSQLDPLAAFGPAGAGLSGDV